MSFSCFVLVYLPIDLYSWKALCQQSLFCISERINILIKSLIRFSIDVRLGHFSDGTATIDHERGKYGPAK